MMGKRNILQQFRNIDLGFLIKCICTFFTLSTGIAAYAQKQERDEIKDLFSFYREHHFQEKIYLHTDNSLYITGEILWGKVYVTDAHLHQSSDISKIAYIEIIDASQKPIWQSSMGIDKGKGENSWLIPSSINTGNYTLRCYTNWMKNTDPAFYFEKNITIINPLKKPVAIATDNSSKIKVDFFPEGGYLVSGLSSILAIKATDATGNGIPIKGSLLIPDTDTILHFETNEQGLGKSLFSPQHGKKYEAWIQEPGGKWQSVSLPEIADQGYTMLLDDSDKENITLTINSNTSSSESVCYLFIHCRQTLLQAITAKYMNGKAIFKLSKTGIGEGISHLTVFNENRNPVMERLYFNKPTKLLKINLSANKQKFKSREKVTLVVETILPGGKFDDASLSAAVIKTDSAEQDGAASMISYFYLQSDIPGLIESPANYLRPESGELADLLLLTFGWRRFNWKDVLTKTVPSFEFLPEYSGQIISGKLLDNNRQAAGAGKTAFASIPGNRYQVSITRSTDSGKLNFPFAPMAGTAVLALQPDLKKDSLYQTDWQSPFTKEYSSYLKPAFSQTQKSASSILEMVKNVQLQQVFVGDKLNNYQPPLMFDTTTFFGIPDKNYFLDNFTRFSTMEEVFREFVPEVEIRKNKLNYRILVNNLPYKAFFREEPLMLLDGVQITDPNKVMQLNPLLIKNIGIVARRYYIAGFTYPGIISFQTYDGDMTGLSLNPRVLLVDYEGIQVKREFYSPQYPTDKDLQNRLPDLRRLLYWAPDIKTGVTGKTSLSFYTADLPGKYVIRVEGMTESGVVGSSLTYFEVK